MAIFSKLLTLIGLLATANLVVAGWHGPGVYVLTNGAANLNLDLSGGKRAPGTKVQGW